MCHPDPKSRTQRSEADLPSEKIQNRRIRGDVKADRGSGILIAQNQNKVTACIHFYDPACSGLGPGSPPYHPYEKRLGLRGNAPCHRRRKARIHCHTARQLTRTDIAAALIIDVRILIYDQTDGISPAGTADAVIIRNRHKGRIAIAGDIFNYRRKYPAAV